MSQDLKNRIREVNKQVAEVQRQQNELRTRQQYKGEEIHNQVDKLRQMGIDIPKDVQFDQLKQIIIRERDRIKEELTAQVQQANEVLTAVNDKDYHKVEELLRGTAQPKQAPQGSTVESSKTPENAPQSAETPVSRSNPNRDLSGDQHPQNSGPQPVPDLSSVRPAQDTGGSLPAQAQQQSGSSSVQGNLINPTSNNGPTDVPQSNLQFDLDSMLSEGGFKPNAG